MLNSIKWSYAGDPCSGLEECLALIKTGKKHDGFFLCERGSSFFQGSGYGEGPYYCEMGFEELNGAGTKVYEYPEEVSWDGLLDIARRFEGGEDFSQSKDHWKCTDGFDKSNEKAGKRRVIGGLSVLWLIGMAVAGYVIFYMKG